MYVFGDTAGDTSLGGITLRASMLIALPLPIIDSNTLAARPCARFFSSCDASIRLSRPQVGLAAVLARYLDLHLLLSSFLEHRCSEAAHSSLSQMKTFMLKEQLTVQRN